MSHFLAPSDPPLILTILCFWQRGIIYSSHLWVGDLGVVGVLWHLLGPLVRPVVGQHVRVQQGVVEEAPHQPAGTQFKKHTFEMSQKNCYKNCQEKSLNSYRVAHLLWERFMLTSKSKFRHWPGPQDKFTNKRNFKFGVNISPSQSRWATLYCRWQDLGGGISVRRKKAVARRTTLL